MQDGDLGLFAFRRDQHASPTHAHRRRLQRRSDHSRFADRSLANGVGHRAGILDDHEGLSGGAGLHSRRRSGNFPGPFDTGPDIDPLGNEYRTPVAKVKVTSVKTADDPQGLRTFDITFVGDSGLQDQPALVLGSTISNDHRQTVTLSYAQRHAVTTTKECSPEFRVNPPEPDNPFTPLPDVTQQSNPAVAMDADGDFVITWQSEVPDSVTPGSKNRHFRAAIFSAVVVRRCRTSWFRTARSRFWKANRRPSP